MSANLHDQVQMRTFTASFPFSHILQFSNINIILKNLWLNNLWLSTWSPVFNLSVLLFVGEVEPFVVATTHLDIYWIYKKANTNITYASLELDSVIQLAEKHKVNQMNSRYNDQSQKQRRNLQGLFSSAETTKLYV